MALLNTSNLTFSYAGEPILQDITLKIEPGARIGIIGRNGSGKSTLLNLFDDRLEPSEGSVRIAPGTRVSFQTQGRDASMDRAVRMARRWRLRLPHVVRSAVKSARHSCKLARARSRTR